MKSLFVCFFDLFVALFTQKSSRLLRSLASHLKLAANQGIVDIQFSYGIFMQDGTGIVRYLNEWQKVRI
jgi:TPR repeat protein